MGITILSETAISTAELRDELDKTKKRDKELNFRAAKTDEYLQQFVELDSKKAKQLFNKIDALKIPRLKEQHIIKIVDLMPKTVEGLKVILQAYTITVNNENLKKMISEITEVSK